MPFPDLQLIPDVMKGPGATLPYAAEATGIPAAGNNVIELPFVDAGVDPALIDASRLKVYVEVDPARPAGGSAAAGVTDCRFVSLTPDKRFMTLDFATNGTGAARVTVEVNHTIEGVGTSVTPLVVIAAPVGSGGGGGGGFTATLAAFGFSTSQEIGAELINPQFNAGYSAAPVSAVLSDDQGNPAQNVLAVPNPLTMPFTYQENAINASVLFTLLASDGVNNSSPQVTVSFLPRVYWGLSANPALATEADIEALSTSALGANKGRTFVVAPAAEYIYYAFPVAFAAGPFDFSVNGFPGGFLQQVASVNVTAGTPGAPVVAYQLWRSTNLLTGNFTVVVTP